MTKMRQTTKKKCSSWWSCCFATPQSSSSSPSRHGGGVSSWPTAEPSLPRSHSAATQLSVYQEMEPDRSLEKVATLDVASRSHSAATQLSVFQEIELDRSLEQVAALIVNKLREIKGLKLKDVAKEGEETNVSWDFLKINSDGFKYLKQILEEGISCAESLQKYVPEHGGKELTHAIIPILEDIGSQNMETLIKEAVERMFNGYLLCSYQMSSSRLHGL